jgi:DNA-binding beta-propeller fold protein YncE
MLRLTGGAVVGLLLAGCGGGGAGTTTAPVEETTSGGAAGVRGIVFNTASRDVTLFDPATNRVTGSRPTSAVARWLSNEQRYFDGESIWTYDYPEGEVVAVAIDPESFEVTRQIPTEGDGPGHSFVLTPDNGRGFVNAAESDFLAVVDPEAGEVIERIETGAYP